jgi:uncharacterized RDD family membrane protein YckC
LKNQRVEKESINDTKEKDPVVAFGDPYTVAKSISRGQDWGTAPVDYVARFGAFLIDQIIIQVAIVIVVVWWIFGMLVPALEAPSSLLLATFGGIFLLLPYISFWAYGYFVILEKRFSRTIGKGLLGISVYDESGVRLTWSQALIRNITKAEMILLLLEVIISRDKNKNHQRLLDIVAKTIVVREDE